MSDSILPVAELEPSAKRTLSWLWIAVGVLLVVAVGAALLTRGDERSPEERFQAVTGAVADAETFSYEMTFSTSAGPMNMDMAMEGAVDVAAARRCCWWTSDNDARPRGIQRRPRRGVARR